MAQLLQSPYAFIKKWVLARPRGLWVAMISTMVLGLATHIYVFTNNLFIGDGYGYYYYTPNDRPARTRWLLHIVEWLHDWLQIPWVIGVLELLVFGVAVFYLYKLFRLKSVLSMLLVSAVVVTFPALTTYNAHLFSAVGYAVAFLCGVLAVWFIERPPLEKKWLGALLSAVMTFVALALYQSMLCLSATLMAYMLIRGILLGEKDTKRVLTDGLWFVAAFLAGLLAYVASIAVLQLGWEDVGLGTFTRGITPQNVFSRTPAEWLEAVWLTLSTTFSFYFKPEFVSFIRLRDNLAFVLAFLAGGVLTGLVAWRGKLYKKRGQLVLLVLLFLLIPFTMDMFHLLRDLEFRIIMYYSLAIPLLYGIWLLDHTLGRADLKKLRSTVAASWAMLLSTLLLCFNFWMLANTCYLAMQNTYQRSMELANRVVMTVESVPGYQYGVPVYILGDYQTYSFERAGFEVIEDMSGIYYELAFHGNRFLPLFIRAHLGQHYVVLSLEDQRAMLADPRIAEMPSYPQEGCVQFFEEKLVLRFD